VSERPSKDRPTWSWRSSPRAPPGRDRGEKLRLYADAGVREYWIVDPDAREISFFVNRAGRFEVALALDALYRSEVLPELILDLADLWREFESRLPHS
jgi:Uma2 family endonuclease